MGVGLVAASWYMARTASDVEDELDALKSARASGVLEVQLGGRRTRFADGPDLAGRINSLERELAMLNGTTPNHRYIVTRKGT